MTLDGAVLRLTLDRPDKRNALDDEMVAGLIDAIDAAGRDERVRAIVLAGAGDHFCGGADIVARNAGGRDAPRPRVGSIQRRVPSHGPPPDPAAAVVQVPVVCRVQGWAAGIGFHLALPPTSPWPPTTPGSGSRSAERGFTPDSGGTWLLPRLVGMVRARELLLLGRELHGAEAADWGLIHAAVPADELDAEVEALVAPAGRRADGGPRPHQVAAAQRPDDPARRPAAGRGLRPRAVVAQRGLPRGPRRLQGEARPRLPRPMT